MERHVEFPSQGALLRGRLYLPATAGRRPPIVIMAHGFSATAQGMVADADAAAFYDSASRSSSTTIATSAEATASRASRSTAGFRSSATATRLTSLPRWTRSTHHDWRCGATARVAVVSWWLRRSTRASPPWSPRSPPAATHRRLQIAAMRFSSRWPAFTKPPGCVPRRAEQRDRCRSSLRTSSRIHRP